MSAKQGGGAGLQKLGNFTPLSRNIFFHRTLYRTCRVSFSDINFNMSLTKLQGVQSARGFLMQNCAELRLTVSQTYAKKIRITTLPIHPGIQSTYKTCFFKYFFEFSLHSAPVICLTKKCTFLGTGVDSLYADMAAKNISF